MAESGPGITVVAFGPVGREVLEYLRGALAPVFGLPVRVADTPLSLTGVRTRRGQYRAPEMVDALRDADIPEAPRVLGVTEAALYAEGMNFIFGQAELNGRPALVSLHRLHPEFHRRPTDQALFLRRALIECVHELGHTLGLGHCPLATCVMHFSPTIRETDRKGPAFCSRHAERIREQAAVLAGHKAPLGQTVLVGSKGGYAGSSGRGNAPPSKGAAPRARCRVRARTPFGGGGLGAAIRRIGRIGRIRRLRWP